MLVWRKAYVGFAAVDIAGTRLIEINVANPGGLATLESLTGIDPAPRAAEAIANRSSHRPSLGS